MVLRDISCQDFRHIVDFLALYGRTNMLDFDMYARSRARKLKGIHLQCDNENISEYLRSHLFLHTVCFVSQVVANEFSVTYFILLTKKLLQNSQLRYSLKTTYSISSPKVIKTKMR